MAKYKSGQKLMCEPCGREIVVDSCGLSATSVWCCGKPMKESGARRSTKHTAKKSKIRK